MVVLGEMIGLQRLGPTATAARIERVIIMAITSSLR